MSDRDRPVQSDFIDIQQIANEIRNRIEQQFPLVDSSMSVDTSESARPAQPFRRRMPTAIEIRMPNSEEFLQQSSANQLLIGQLPPSPSTFRGRIGRLLVSVVHRALFWYTPQVHRFQRAVENSIREQLGILHELNAHINALIAKMSNLMAAVERVTALERQLAQFARTTQERFDTVNTAELDRHIHNIARQLEDTRIGLRAEVVAREQIQSQIDTFTETLNTQGWRETITREEFQDRLNAITDVLDRVRVEALETASLKTKLLIQTNRIDSIVQQLRQSASHPTSLSSTHTTETDAMPGSLYVEFENIFRGERVEIKRRLSAYIPRLRALGVGSVAMPVIDLGCGRGEWLEVLLENGMSGTGVDSNHAMVEESKVRGLTVQAGDAVEYLRNLPSESQGGVTGFHLVEHMQIERLIELLDQTVRVLKSGGIAIFETPNPENVIVSTHTFRLDPTHRFPVPPALLQFLAESRGLGSAEIIYLHPYPESYKIHSATEGSIAAFLNQHFYGPQDYAVVAKKH